MGESGERAGSETGRQSDERVGEHSNQMGAAVSAAAAPANEPTSTPSALVVTGPSGVGKGTLIRRLLEAAPQEFAFSVSHCTRAPREGEQVCVNER